MAIKLIAGSKYSHRSTPLLYIQVEKIEELEEYYKVSVIWRKRSDNSIVIQDIIILYMLKNSLGEWNSYGQD